MIKYPVEYEILSLNPPLPTPPRRNKRELREEQRKIELPTDKYAKKYMWRYDRRTQSTREITDAEREEYYYRKKLGIPTNDLTSAMGRKSVVLSHAYDFALKQFEVMQKNDGMTEEESIAAVEKILAEEEQKERFIVRKKARALMKEKAEEKEELKKAKPISTEPLSPPPPFTVPSILHSKPRTIEALNLWGQRLQAVPYNQWTLGAATALDHWIAVDVLGMSEDSWDRLLDGTLESDIENSRGTEVNIGDMARARDIINVRNTLFPETSFHASDEDFDEIEDTTASDLIEARARKDDGRDETERSIDELLASLGGYDEEELEDSPSEEVHMDIDSRIQTMVDKLQDWRAKNLKTPFDNWDQTSKDEFNAWMSEYLSLVSTDTDRDVDIEATRNALLSELPQYREESDSFWSTVEDETDAEIFLHELHKAGAPTASDDETPVQKKNREQLETFLAMPYSKQLKQLLNLGALRPILDEYSTEANRAKFMERHGETLLEGMEIEHLVSDPNGTITLDDIDDKSLIDQDSVEPDQRFSIKLVPYGTDEFGYSRSGKARAMYRAWNAQKSGRARHEEAMFKLGKLPLKDGDEVQSEKK